jgi:hypothetical protein
VREMTARGERLRADDNPEVLKGRLAAYRAQTAPLVDHYAAKSLLRSVDGMASINEVTRSIDRALGAARPAKEAAPAKTAPRKRKAKAKSAKGPKGRAKPARAKAGRGRKAGSKGRASGLKAGRTARPKNQAGRRKLRTRRRLTKAR